MGKRGTGIAFCLTAALLASALAAPRAEVSADPEHGVMLMILGITEGPDPIPQVIWEPVRDVDPILFLNPEGGDRGDGRPAASFHPVTMRPHVVWAYAAGVHHDIAYSRWSGAGWTGPEMLTSLPSDELDPRAFVAADGEVFVVWWEALPERIWMSRRPSGLSAWADPEPVTGVVDSGRRPSILERGDGTVLAAYERDATRTGQEIVIATRVGEGVYTTRVIASTSSAKPLNVILHAEGDALWVDWRHSDSEYAYSVYEDGDWSDWSILPWSDDSWIRSDEVRRLIRTLVLGD